MTLSRSQGKPEQSRGESQIDLQTAGSQEANVETDRAQCYSCVVATSFDRGRSQDLNVRSLGFLDGPPNMFRLGSKGVVVQDVEYEEILSDSMIPGVPL